MRTFKVLIQSRYNGMIGTLIGDIDYLGCVSGWHPLEFENGTRGLFAGNEIMEVSNGTKTE